MNTENFDIDIVYLWVDGNDPIWRAKRDAFIGKTSEDSSRNCEGRYADNDELKYSLRSIEKYAPWIRNIYIVTDNQQPSWLDISCPKVKIIDLTEIMPREVLPCFNSSLIEKFLHNNPGWQNTSCIPTMICSSTRRLSPATSSCPTDTRSFASRASLSGDYAGTWTRNF